VSGGKSTYRSVQIPRASSELRRIIWKWLGPEEELSEIELSVQRECNARFCPQNLSPDRKYDTVRPAAAMAIMGQIMRRYLEPAVTKKAILASVSLLNARTAGRRREVSRFAPKERFQRLRGRTPGVKFVGSA
jgi:hypothetical protein